MVVELSDYIPVNFICLLVLAALGLRKIVRMDGHHRLRVVLLTGLLWLPVLFIFLSILAGMLMPPVYFHCTPRDDDSGAYTLTEY